MLTFDRLGTSGRLGNQLFRIAFLTYFAETHGIEYGFPHWSYSKYFAHTFSTYKVGQSGSDLEIKEPGPGNHLAYFESLLPKIRSSRVNVRAGYFQSHSYFTKAHALKIFAPAHPVELRFTNAVAISVRRGDFLTSPYFNVIEPEVYIKLIDTYFPTNDVVVFSDDVPFCKQKFLGTRYAFADLTDIEDLFLMSRFQNFILSNSTFSYWGAFLSPDPKKILYPKYMFADMDRCRLYNQIYWPKSPCYVPYDNPINKPAVVMRPYVSRMEQVGSSEGLGGG